MTGKLARVEVETPSRLHFTLIDLNGELGRVDGGVGVALEQPKFRVEAEPARRLVVTGVKSRLAEAIAERFLRHYGLKPLASIRVFESIPEHVGLGSRTQLSLGISRVLADIHGIRADARELASVMGRGGTSGIGLAAFEGGGFMLDGGHSFGLMKQKQCFLPSSASKAPPAPLLARYRLPESWFFVVAVPHVRRGKHGVEEVDIFKSYCPLPAEEVNRLSRLILMRMLPSVVEMDIATFGSALTEVQTMGFKKIEVELQDRLVKRTMEYMKEEGAYGVGMSSFGPAVYGLASGRGQAEKLAESVKNFLEAQAGGFVFYTKTDNRGAVVRRFQ